MLAYSTRKRPVGSDREAREAVSGSLDWLDNGLFKQVYRSRDGKCVYKLSRGFNRHRDDLTTSRAKALVAEAAWCALGKREGTPGIPPVTLYVINGTPVLAMPYYPLDRYDLSDAVLDRAYKAWYSLGLDDLHEQNVRGDSRGRPVVCDLGAWNDSYPRDTLPEAVMDMCTSEMDREEEDEEEYFDSQCESCHSHYTGCGHTGYHYGDCDCYTCQEERDQWAHDNDECDPDYCAFTHESEDEDAGT